MNQKFKKDIEYLNDFLPLLKRMDVVLLCGPKSYEDKIYFESIPFDTLSSGFIFKTLSDMGLTVRVVDNTSLNLEKQLVSADVVFINMHGEYGEDGSIQGLLNYLNKPFTGSSIFSNTVGINKVRFKKFVDRLHYKTPTWHSLTSISEEEIKKFSQELGYPVMLKLVTGGSSIGMYFLKDEQSIKDTINSIFKSGHSKKDFFLEKYIEGQSCTVSVFDLPTQTIVSPPLLIETKTFLYDEKTKIDSQLGVDLVKCQILNIAPSDTINLNAQILNIYKELECKGFVRIDFVFDSSNTVQILEINTIPGLQKDSNFFTCMELLEFSPDQILLSLLYNAVH